MSDWFANFRATVNVQEERRIGREMGKEIGKEIGRGIGEEIKLIKQICAKCARGQSVDQIATDLVEDEDHVKSIVEVAARYAPDYDADKIYDELHDGDPKEETEESEELVKA